MDVEAPGPARAENATLALNTQGLIALDDVFELLSEQTTELVELISREQQREGKHAR